MRKGMQIGAIQYMLSPESPTGQLAGAAPKIIGGSALRRLSILIAIAAFSSGCASLTGVRPRIKSIQPRIASIDLDGVNLAFDLGVDNPYPVALRAPKFRYALAVEGAPFLREEAVSNVDVPAMSLGAVTLPMRLSYADLWKAFQSLSGVNEASYRLDGAFVFNAMGETVDLPLSHSGKFPVLRAPSVSILKMRPTEFSWNKAGLAVDAELMNPNVFKIGLQSLGYDLRFGDIPVASFKAATLSEIGAGKSGTLNLTGEARALDAVRQIFSGDSLGKLKLAPAGTLMTPYGPVSLPTQAP